MSFLSDLFGGRDIRAAGRDLAAASREGGAIRAAGFEEGAGTIAETRDRSLARLQPTIDTGGNALERFGDLIGLNGTEASTNALEAFRTSPGFEFALDRGVEAIDRSAAAGGMLRSGGTLKALTEFGHGLGNSEFQNHLANLGLVSNTGQNALSLATGVDTTAGNNIAQLQVGEGNARAGGVEGAGEALATAKLQDVSLGNQVFNSLTNLGLGVGDLAVKANRPQLTLGRI